MKTSQQPLLLCVVLVTLSSLGWSTTYYVDSANGNDSNAGTSTSAPWKTIAKVNGSSFLPGDSVLFMRGDVWRETLTIPSSGSAGNVITFDAYGTGANPQINAADTVSSWTNVSGNVWSVEVAWTPHEVARNKTRAQNVALQSALVQNYQWYYNGSNTLYICSSTNPNGDGSVWEVARRNNAMRFDNRSHIVIQNVDFWYSNSVSGGVATSPASPQTDIAFSNVNVDYAWSYGISLNNASASISNITFNNVNIDHCCVQTGGISALFTALYTQTTNPTTNLTISGGRFSYSGVDASIGVANPVFAINIDNCTNCTVTGVTTDHNGSDGINIENGSNGVTITKSALHDDGQALAGDRNELGIGGNGSGSSNITVDGVDMYNDVSGQAAIEIASSSLDGLMSNVTISHCQIHNNGGSGFQIGGGHTGIVFEYNLVYGNGGYGYFDNQGASGNPSVLMYGNVFWGNGSASRPANWEIAAAGGTTAMNNITGQANGANPGSGSEIIVLVGYWLGASDYNDWYHSAGGNFMGYQGNAYNFAGWQSHSGQDAHSLSVDPQFVSSNPSGPNDFKLRPTSPLIGAGTNLGTAYEYGLDTQSSNFPYVTFNQNLSANGWDIGAFVFRQSFILVVK